MKLCAFKLLQPTVFAITFLLIVMHLEQGWCLKNAVVLYHDMSHNYLTTYRNKTITTMPEEDKYKPYQCFVMDSVNVGNEMAVTIYNAAIDKYLCLNRQGDLKLKNKKHFGKVCLFKEEFAQDTNGHLQFRSMCTGKNHTLALNKYGRPYRIRNAPNTINNIKKLSLFTKINDKTCYPYIQQSPKFNVQSKHRHTIMHCNKKKA